MSEANMRKEKLKANNSGSTMVMIIVAVALIGILASVLMSMSYINYRMKVTELKSKDNFYSAETVLDQISVGLQQEASNSMEDAYSQAMQRYTQENTITMSTVFSNLYLTELRGKLRQNATDVKYQVDGIDSNGDGVADRGLVSYLDSNLQNAVASGNLIINSSEYKMQTVATESTDDEGKTVYNSKGLVLYELHISYTDSEGYTSVIDTDIRIQAPDLTLVTKSAMPNVFEYSLVADNSITGTNTGDVVFNGDVYAGLGGMSLNNASRWNFPTGNRIVSGGPVVIGPTASFTTGDTSNTWVNSFELTKAASASSGSLSLKGYTYVKDDLTVNGRNATVTLQGNYFGYGNGNTAEGSSAIVLNGTNSVLDMSGLNTLMLAGNAYIQTSQVSYTPSGVFESNHNQNILTGNSLAIKSDQIAYLVPAECIGVNDGITVIGRNPMTQSEYETWVQYTNKRNNGVDEFTNFDAVSFTKSTNLLGAPLSGYEKNGSGYKTVFRQINGQSICYVYLDLTANGAADYYSDYYAAAKARMDSYVTTYDNRILVNNDMTRQDISGNMLSYTLGASGAISIVEDTINSDSTIDAINALKAEQDSYNVAFARLNAKLTLEENAVTADEMTKSVYSNLIKESVVNALPAYIPGDSSTIKTYEVAVTDTQNAKAVVVNNRGGDTYVYTDSSIRLIIATGNVELTKDFQGLIICDGIVTIDGTVSNISASRVQVVKILQSRVSAEASAKTIVATYFANGDLYSFDTSSSDAESGIGSGTGLGNLIVYENWSKN